jgi:hypothetical protein
MYVCMYVCGRTMTACVSLTACVVRFFPSTENSSSDFLALLRRVTENGRPFIVPFNVTCSESHVCMHVSKHICMCECTMYVCMYVCHACMWVCLSFILGGIYYLNVGSKNYCMDLCMCVLYVCMYVRMYVLYVCMCMHMSPLLYDSLRLRPWLCRAASCSCS